MKVLYQVRDASNRKIVKHSQRRLKMDCKAIRNELNNELEAHGKPTKFIVSKVNGGAKCSAHQ